MDALPLTRHGWHGDWNYTLRPEPYDPDAGTPDPFDQPSPDLAWLCHPALTGLPPAEWDALTAALMTLHDQQREDSPDKRRGHRPRIKAGPGTGRRPVLTLADRLLAAVLHDRLALPQVAVAALFGVRPETVNKRIRDIRELLDQAAHPHPARPAPPRQPRRPLQARKIDRHRYPVRDQDGVLMICKPFKGTVLGQGAPRLSQDECSTVGGHQVPSLRDIRPDSGIGS